MNELLRSRLPRAVEIGLLLGIAAQGLQLSAMVRDGRGAVAIPPSQLAAQNDHRASMLAAAETVQAAHLFGAVEPVKPPPTEGTTTPSGYTLHGVMQSTLVNWQFAILASADGHSAMYRSGAALDDGSTLEEIGADFAIVSNGDQRTKLLLPVTRNASELNAPPPSAAAVTTSENEAESASPTMLAATSGADATTPEP